MKLPISLIIHLLDECILIAVSHDVANEKVAGELFAYKAHLQQYYKDSDSVSLPETIVNMMVRLNSI